MDKPFVILAPLLAGQSLRVPAERNPVAQWLADYCDRLAAELEPMQLNAVYQVTYSPGLQVVEVGPLSELQLQQDDAAGKKKPGHR